MSLAEFAANQVAPVNGELPKDYQFTVEWDGTRGHASIPRKQELSGSDIEKERQLLEEAGYDPDRYMIVGNVRYRKWMRYDQEWLHYYAFDIGPQTAAGSELRQMDVGELAKTLRRPKAVKVPTAGSGCFTVAAADWQVGKGEGGGSPEIARRVSDGIDQAALRVKELRRIGRTMPTGAFVGVGDLVEGACGFYSNQPYLIDLNDREQARVTSALLAYGIEELSPLFDDFLVATSLDNHGQKRQDGKIVTDLSDNKTAEVYDRVYEAFQRDGRYGNLRWVIPNDETSVLVELGGVPVGLAHGDLFSGGGKLAQAKALEWWKGQDFGMQPLRGAQVLMSGHFHHYSCIMHGKRTHFQMPANDGGSKWFKDGAGWDTPPGTFTVVYDSALPWGWTDEMILSS